MAEAGALRVGLMGYGTIGSGVFHLARKNAALLAESAGRPVEIVRALAKALDEVRPYPVDSHLITTDPREMLDDSGIDVFIEVMGGIEPARELSLKVLKSGRGLVTANKELVAMHGAELMKAAADSGAQYFFEAAVGGGIPIIRPLEESLGGDRILKVMGIMNGTTNFILSTMTSGGGTYADALEQAKQLGYAEADPRADVEGADAASKLAILSSIAFKVGVTSSQVYREGISLLRPEDIANAQELGYVIKLLGIAERDDGGGISARVHPTMVPVDHPLASVSGNFNAVFVIGEAVGELMFYGQGAGSMPTATAVLGDVINIANSIGGPAASGRAYWLNAGNMKPIDEVKSRFYMVLKVLDRPGVLAAISGVFGDHMVSLESVVQKGIGDRAQIVLITHEVQESNFGAAREGLEKLDSVLEIPSVIRVEQPSESVGEA